MERTVNIPAHLLLDAEIIRLGRERTEVVKALRSSLQDAQNVVGNAYEKLDEALMVHKGGTTPFEVKLATLNATANAMDLSLSYEKMSYKWQVKLRYQGDSRTCTTMTLPLPAAPQWVEDLWDAVTRAKEGERLVRIQINAAEAAAHGQQVREDATLIVAQRLVPQ